MMHAHAGYAAAAACAYSTTGAFLAQLAVADRVLWGVAVVAKGHWPKLVRGLANANSTVAERDTDMGRGAFFDDNLVEVSACDAG